jgi:hypothetical protein
MKRIMRLAVFCLAFLSIAAFAQTQDVRNVDKFTKIVNSTSGNIYLTQGSPQKVVIEGKKDLIANVETDVSGGKLKIRMKNHWGSGSWFHDDEFKIIITAENLDAIDLSGSGDLTAQNKIVSNNMLIDVNGSGSLHATLEVSGLLETYVAGSGDISLRGTFGNIKSEVSGSGDVEFDTAVTNKAEFNISGSGEIKARGKAAVLVTSISGSGNLDAADFESDKCTIHISGSGDAKVYKIRVGSTDIRQR